MAAGSKSSRKRFVVAATGASGGRYFLRLLQVLLDAGCFVHVTVSSAGREVLKHEEGVVLNLEGACEKAILESIGQAEGEACTRLSYHHFNDLTSPIASGSYITDGMVVCPCSMGTLAAIANGVCTNLIHRAAEVHLKERRKLILVVRETPLSLVHARNIVRAIEAGAVVMPACPGWYHRPKRIEDIIDFVVNRICEHLRVPVRLTPAWGTEPADD